MYFSDDFAKYTLMHKDISVADITVDEIQGGIISIDDVFSIEHFPIGSLENDIPNRKKLNKWWIGRSIPASRDGLKDVLERIGVASSNELITKCLALSLSDQYWIKPKDSNLTWHSVNFFENEFSDDIGELLIGNEIEGNIDLFSPNNATDGWLKKKWKIINSERYLLKGGSTPFYQEPFNEVFASVLMKSLGVYHIVYDLVWDKEYPFSCCKCFVSPNTELVTADKFLQLEKCPNHFNLYQHFLDLCNKQGITGAVDFLNKLITVDYIIANEDRHLNNFGFIRNADTLEWIGFAPIYDSGTSLKYYSKHQKDICCKPFKSTHNEQINLVTSFDWLDFSALDNAIGEAYNLYSYLYDADFISLDRVNQISLTLNKRAASLKEYVQNSNNGKDTAALDDVLLDYSNQFNSRK